MFKKNDSTVYAAGRIVGEVRDGVFRKRCRASVHMLRIPRGWALDSQSLADAERLGAKTVEIEDTESRLRYTATIAQIRAKGIKVDRGFGKQIALPLAHWNVMERGARQLELIPC